MKSAALLSLIAAASAFAQETSKPQPADTAPPGEGNVRRRNAEPPDSPQEVERREALEAKFKETLTSAVFDGRYCTVADGKLGPDKEEKYTIEGVEKTGDGAWTIKAKIEYGGLNFTAPVPVRVEWAGDTAVIIVDNMGFPGTAKYSARVMIYAGTYAGTWSAGDHGGMLHGVIAHPKPEPAKETKPEEQKP
jgi:hypothetical protein